MTTSLPTGAAAYRLIEAWPPARLVVRENRAFLGRTVRFSAAEAGIRQFLDPPGLEILQPGLLTVTQWRPDDPGRADGSQPPLVRAMLGGVGRKPAR